MEAAERRNEEKPHCLKRISNGITGGLETAFFHVGHFVGEYPVLTIVVSLVVCGLCAVGLKTFRTTESQVELWVPQHSPVVSHAAWVQHNFPVQTRFLSVIVESKTDILRPEFLNALMDYYTRSEGITVSGMKFPAFCLKVGGQCGVAGLPQLWGYNSTVIRGLSRTDILHRVNSVAASPTLGYDLATLLGGRVVRSNGRIVSATATQLTWVNTGHTQTVKEWESNMIQIARNGHPKISSTYVYASRSFDDEGYGAVEDDISLLTAGFSIVFVFIMLSLGKFNLLQQKVYVSLAGMLCIGLSLLFAYGLATAMDLIYSPIQSIMPFLLLGIGVDDMFVVIEAWKNLTPEQGALPVPDKMAATLRQAGVSITVTSVTDAVAFGVGASTVIPALRAFCLYAVLGIFALYALVSTFFAACLSLDERRRRGGRDACIPCYRHTHYTPSACSQGASLLQTFFARFYGPALMRTPVKVAVIAVTLVFFGVNVWSFTQLRQEFKLATYIPSDSYAFKYAAAKERLFADQGVDASVFCGGFSYYAYRGRLEQMYANISVNAFVQNGTVTAWFIPFHTWLNNTGRAVSTEAQYVRSLKTFLTSVGRALASAVHFDSDTDPTAITGSYLTLRHVRQPDSARDIVAMESLRSVVDTAGLPPHTCFAYSPSYLTFETNKVLLGELYRNLGLAGAAVLVVTFALIANLWTSLLVFLCVIFTVVDVAGVLQFWGVTIDTASSILLTLTVGLAVDYAAHIGHTFMTISGPRADRTVLTLRTIGPAVFNGGFSTFLAFVLLANSSSYGFVVFFRVFSTVVLFGLFHGLAFLPVMLSIVGPPAYAHADVISKSRSMTVNPGPAQDDPPSVAVTREESGQEVHIEVQDVNRGRGQAYAAPFMISDNVGDGVIFSPGGGPVFTPEDVNRGRGQAYTAPFMISDNVGDGVIFTPEGGPVFTPEQRQQVLAEKVTATFFVTPL